MARMTRQQIDHAIERIQEMAATKKGKQPDQPPKLDGEDMLKMFLAGDVKITPALLQEAAKEYVAKGYSYNKDYADYIASRVNAKINAKAIAEYKRDLKAYQARVGKINVQVRAFKDEAILGDSERAMALLASFEALEF